MLTSRQRCFIAEYLEGPDGEQAAIRAGYSERGARKAAWRLLRHPAVKAEIERQLPAPDPHLEPMEFLYWVMRNPRMSVARRVRAAIALLPYEHAKK